MGMYDYIEGEIKCPYCNNITLVNTQVKWIVPSWRMLKTYHVGDDIPCIDAIYTGASTVRQTMTNKCKSCGHRIKFVARVFEGKLLSIDPVKEEEENNNETN